MLQFDCPFCGYCIHVPDDLAGKTGACAKCRHRVTAPAPASILPSTLDDEFRPVDLSTLDIDVEDRVRGLTPMHIAVEAADVNPGALDLPPEPVQVAIGSLGIVLLISGVLVPVMDGRSGETVNLLQTDHFEGWMILALTVTAIVMCARKRFRWLYIPAIAIAAIVGASYLVHWSTLAEIARTLSPDAAAQAMHWGWVLPVVGAVFIFAASALQPRK